MLKGVWRGGLGILLLHYRERWGQGVESWNYRSMELGAHIRGQPYPYTTIWKHQMSIGVEVADQSRFE